MSTSNLWGLGVLIPALLACGCGDTETGTNSTTDTGSGAVYLVTPDKMTGIAATIEAAGDFTKPYDSVPSSDGSAIYFIATTKDGDPGVYALSIAGKTLSLLASGKPLDTPMGISISSDDKTLYIADTEAGLFELPTSGGAPSLFSSTNCMKPRGLDVANQNGVEMIYFSTGAGACGGGAGIAMVPASGGTVDFAAKGPEFTFPTGVAVATNGDIYVSNPSSDALSNGNILRVSGGMVSEFVSGLGLGYPAGIALDMGNTTLFASGRDAKGHDQVYAITVSTLATTTFNATIGENTAAGGLHRASAKDVFSWSDITIIRCPHCIPVP